MDTEVGYRNLAPEDAPAVWQLGAQAFDWPSERILWDESVVRWFTDYARGLSFVAIRDDQIVGFILCSKRDRQGYVCWVAVDKKWNRQGIGKRLMHYALLALRMAGVDIVSGFVREDGTADSFFLNSGFHSVGLRKLDLVLNLAGDPHRE